MTVALIERGKSPRELWAFCSAICTRFWNHIIRVVFYGHGSFLHDYARALVHPIVEFLF